MTSLKVDQRVHAAFDAKIVEVDDVDSILTYRVEAATGQFIWLRREDVTWMPDPEPDWRPGDVVQYLAGNDVETPIRALRLGDGDGREGPGLWVNESGRNPNISHWWRLGLAKVLLLAPRD